MGSFSAASKPAEIMTRSGWNSAEWRKGCGAQQLVQMPAEAQVGGGALQGKSGSNPPPF